jgi:hypothetical protein
MHADLLETSRQVRERIEAPPFPLAAIRAATVRTETRSSGRRSVVAIVLAGFSIAAIAAAAEVTHQSHLTVLPSGGIVVAAGNAKLSSREIHTEAEIREAAKQLDFQATLPSGLPEGATPTKLDMGGTNLLVITYALPSSQSGRGDKLWIFLANPATISQADAARYRSRNGYASERWRVGAEQVIVVSNGLKSADFAAIKDAMERAAAGP